jgi:hypothetical protein
MEVISQVHAPVALLSVPIELEGGGGACARDNLDAVIKKVPVPVGVPPVVQPIAIHFAD